jgi:HD-GYP domain-containing protein (c-di-GMP phosphodiesterase class II)
MTIRRISIAELVFGEPLRWDIFSTPSASRPLLQKGEVLRPGQLDGWLDAALYAESATPSSVLQSLNQINRRLERILMALREQHNADADLRAIAEELIASVERDADIALAAIFLNQITGAYAVRHCTEAAIIVCLIGRAMGKSPTELLVVTAAALTMNVGMVREVELFQHKDCALSPEERAQVRRHPWASVEMLRFAGVNDEAWLDLVMLHHENADGSGYPEGRLGDEISQNAKLIGLADRYCAFVSARNYRRSLLPPAALARLRVENDMPFDQIVVKYFEQEVGACPPGTLVRLENGEAGVVLSRGAAKVHVLRAADGALLGAVRDTDAAGHAIAEALDEDTARLRFSMRQVWGDQASV